MPDYFTLDEFRFLPGMEDSSKYPDEDVERAAAYIVAVIEREVGTSFVARTKTAVLDGTSGNLVLPDAYVLGVTSASVGDSTVDPTGLVTSAGVLRYKSGYSFAYGIGNVSVTYAAGYSSEPPADIKEAAMQATRARMLEKHGTARVMDRASTLANDAGGSTTFVLAGKDRPTGYPEVDAVIVAWRDKLSGFGFA